MIDSIMLYVASGFLIFWGSFHLFPTGNVVRGFGEISVDNKRILTMEWVIEGVSLIFTGAITALITVLKPGHQFSQWIYLLIAIFLFVLSVISLRTGARINFLPYKLCPVIFALAAILIFLGGVI